MEARAQSTEAGATVSRTVQEQLPSVHSSTGGRSSISVNSVEPSSTRSTSASRPSQSSNSVEQPPSARSVITGRSSLPTNSIEQPPSARSTSASCPLSGIKTVPLVPSSVPISLRPTSSYIPPDIPPIDHRRCKRTMIRMSLDLGSMKLRDTGNQCSPALQDQLRLAEERCEEAEVRAWQLEKQISTLGEGVSLEARLLSRKLAALQPREAALRAAAQTHGNSSEVIALQIEAETARDEATSALEQLHEAECEIKSIQIMTQRMILTQEGMNTLVGIHAEIAGARYEYWSSFAPLPVDVVLDAGQKGKENIANDDLEEKDKVPRDSNELSRDGNIENMLLVEKGLRELASLKVEEAVALAMALKRRPSSLKSDDVKLPTEGQHDAFELSPEECEDVIFKQAWLRYFWRRAKKHGLEPDVAEERL